MTLKARDLVGEEWEAREITDEEFEKISSFCDGRRSGAKHMLLLDDGHAGIAFPKSCESSAMYYGGLEYCKGEEDVIVNGISRGEKGPTIFDNERYVAWIFDKLRDAYYESDYYQRFFRNYDKEDSNAWDFVGPILDPTWFEEC